MNKKNIIQFKNDIIRAIYCMVKNMIKNAKRREETRRGTLIQPHSVYVINIYIRLFTYYIFIFGYVFVKLQK